MLITRRKIEGHKKNVLKKDKFHLKLMMLTINRLIKKNTLF